MVRKIFRIYSDMVTSCSHNKLSQSNPRQLYSFIISLFLRIVSFFVLVLNFWMTFDINLNLKIERQEKTKVNHDPLAICVHQLWHKVAWIVIGEITKQRYCQLTGKTHMYDDKKVMSLWNDVVKSLGQFLNDIKCESNRTLYKVYVYEWSLWTKRDNKSLFLHVCYRQ